MCFSATASFTSGVVLTIVGIASMRKASISSGLAFAGVPFIFAVQQFSEGFVWLSLNNPAFAGWETISTKTFLIFAHIVWPIWIPFSILLLEKNYKKKNILYLLLGCGVVLSFSYAWCLAVYPVVAKIDGHHIAYILNYPAVLFTLTTIFYGLATILPAFISSADRMKLLGIAITVSYIFTSLFYQEYITSVWCYFAALLSIIIYWILYGLEQLSLNIVRVKIKDPI